MAQAVQGAPQACHDAKGGLRNHPRILRHTTVVLIFRGSRFDRGGESEYRRQVLSELIVQFAGKGSPLVVADFEKTPGQDGSFSHWPAPGGLRDR